MSRLRDAEVVAAKRWSDLQEGEERWRTAVSDMRESQAEDSGRCTMREAY